jgi:putative ABC transport system permease protein
MKELRQELRIVLRGLLRNPTFTIVAVLTLALGVGVNTAIFSVVKAVLLNPPPYPEADRLTLVYQKNLTSGQISGVSAPNYVDWRTQTRTIDVLAAMNQNFVRASTVVDSNRVLAAEVTANMWDILGVKPLFGRVFTAEEHAQRRPVAVVSYSFWEQMLGRDPQAVGKEIRINKAAFTVIGVLPPNIKFPYWTSESKVITPLAIDNAHIAEDQRSQRDLILVGRLRHGVSRHEAQADLGEIAARLAETYPQANKGWGAVLTPMHHSIIEFAAPVLMLLTVAAVLVLIIACINVAHLFMARSTERTQEFAVRLALGATHKAILRMLVLESGIISLLGCGLGILSAVWALVGVLKLGANQIPRLEEARIDGGVFAFAAFTALTTGLIFAAAAAFRSVKTNPNAALKSASSRSTESQGRRRFRKFLVVSEIALTIVALIATGATVSSFLRIQQINPGFDIRNILTLRVDAPSERNTEAQEWRRFYDTALTRISAVSGVKAAAAVNVLPLGGGANYSFSVIGADSPTTGDLTAQFRSITPNYFQLLAVPVRRGRSFTDQDNEHSPKVILINETFARRAFPNEDAIGKLIIIKTPDYGADEVGSREPREIIGILPDIHEAKLTDPAPAAFYVPYRQTAVRRMRMIVRPFAPSTSQLATAVRSAVQSVGGEPEVLQVQTLEGWLAETLAPRRFNAVLMTVFAALAILLSGIGAYAIMAQSVGSRIHEFGVRMGLGASGKQIQWMVLRQASLLGLTGVVVGAAVAHVCAHYLQTQVDCACSTGGGASQSTLSELMRQGFSYFLGNLRPDLQTVFASCAFILGICVIASWVPARRASRVDPMITLREQ